MIVLVELSATLSSALFAGAALYVTLVEHPARLHAGPDVALAEFPPSYRRGAALQAPLAVVAGVGGVAAWLMGDGVVWLVAGALIFAAVPFTLVCIMPVTHALLEPSIRESPTRGMELLHRWGRLHLVRTVLGVLGLCLFLWGLVVRG